MTNRQTLLSGAAVDPVRKRSPSIMFPLLPFVPFPCSLYRQLRRVDCIPDGMSSNDLNDDRMLPHPVVPVTQHIPASVFRLSVTVRIGGPGHNGEFTLSLGIPHVLPASPCKGLARADEPCSVPVSAAVGRNLNPIDSCLPGVTRAAKNSPASSSVPVRIVGPTSRSRTLTRGSANSLKW